MSREYERLLSCLQCVREKVDFQPKIAIVLGSGRGNYGENIDVHYTLDYSEIENFPVSTVAGLFVDFDVSPWIPGSQSITSSSTKFGA